MNVSKNAYYHWVSKASKSVEKPSLVLLKERIVAIFKQSNEVYGSKRIQKALEREGLCYCVSYIALLMKELGIKSVLKKRFVVTTDSNHSLGVADNLLARDFRAERLGEKWVSDITFIRVANSWRYLTTILDLADRKIVAWVLSQDMTTQNTTLKAWRKAREIRKITDNHIFHSDRGVQYASYQMQKCFNHPNKAYRQSMSRKANCWDNAVAESFFKTIKYECLDRYHYNSYFDLYHRIDSYINWYNYKRLHSSLEYETPAERELKIKLKQRVIQKSMLSKMS